MAGGPFSRAQFFDLSTPVIFNTYWFILFTVCFFPVYWLLRQPTARAVWLLGSCVVFHYFFAGPAGVMPIVVLGIITYFCALSRQKSPCVFGIIFCASALVLYKSTYFLCADLLGPLNAHWSTLAQKTAHNWLPAAPPLAISFFTFEFVHYLVEVYRGHAPMRGPGEFVRFAIYFPSLVAGPIKRYEEFNPNLKQGLGSVPIGDVAAGAQRIGIGLIKKVVVADNLTLMLKFYESDFNTLSPGDAWLFLVGLGARILFDFSGYSDIAIGLSQMMGVRLPENFRFPYLAVNLKDFWSRWHISLSTWIRDYIYIPLGGNRHGLVRRTANGAIAFALCGMWHGPAWNFILWGLWHGFGLAINSTYRSWTGPVGKGISFVFDKVPALSWLVTILFVGFGWLLFFYEPTRAWSMAVKLMSFR